MIDIRDETYIKSYSELSLDTDKGESLVDIEHKKAIDFDAVAEDFGKEYNIDTLKSCDALIYSFNDNNSVYKFIEFKNGKFGEFKICNKCGQSDKAEIRDKLYFSIFMLSVIEDEKVSKMKFEFELVYNPIAIFPVKTNNNEVVEAQLDQKRRAKKELRDMQYYNDNTQKAINGYNESYSRKTNHIVKMTSITSKAFEERERNAI